MSTAFGRAVGVLVVGVLLLQHVPLGPLAQRLANVSQSGCTERVCHCGADCACAHCAKHNGAASFEDGNAPATSSSEGSTLRSCSGPAQGPTGAFVVAKSLIGPGPSPVAEVPRSTPSLSQREAFLVPQRWGDDIFHPPKERIG